MGAFAPIGMKIWGDLEPVRGAWVNEHISQYHCYLFSFPMKAWNNSEPKPWFSGNLLQKPSGRKSVNESGSRWLAEKTQSKYLLLCFRKVMQTTVTFDSKRSFRLRHFSGFGLGFFSPAACLDFCGHVDIFAAIPQSRALDATLLSSPCPSSTPPRWPRGKVSASRAAELCSIPGFAVDLFQVKSYQWLKHWYSSGYPDRLLVLWGQRWDWLPPVSVCCDWVG